MSIHLPQPPGPPTQGGAVAGAMPTPADLALGKQLLFYRPDGPLGATFSCSACAAQARQPELIEHRSGCPYQPGPPP